ncbi:hypothetical protein [Streptomyces sp. NPDC047009]|uniref:hypothetical protein n=1 Tax=Streptomyces sp. NPDC047009 TaxID=3154496 RepID=UPI0033D1E382
MRACYVPVRLVATALAVAAAAGCMSVGDDAGSPSPSHSTGRHGGAALDGGTVVGEGVGGGRGGAAVKGGKHEPDASASGTSASPSASESRKGAKGKGDQPTAKGMSKNGDGGDGGVPPAPTNGEPSSTDTPPDPPSPFQPDPPSPTPTTAEPSSSAHEQTTQLMQREPAPQAGAPAV